jgi:putative two-component system response regulator
MPEGIRGHDLLAVAIENSSLTPFVLMTGRPTLDSAIDAIRLGAYDYLTKPFNLDYVQLTLTRALHTAGWRFRIVLIRKTWTGSQRTHRGTAEFSLNSVQSLSKRSGSSAIRILSATRNRFFRGSDFSRQEMGVENVTMWRFVWPPSCTIWKIGIPDSILLQPGDLTPEEYQIMKSHAEIGYKYTRSHPISQGSKPYVYEHHERWDGWDIRKA